MRRRRGYRDSPRGGHRQSGRESWQLERKNRQHGKGDKIPFGGMDLPTKRIGTNEPRRLTASTRKSSPAGLLSAGVEVGSLEQALNDVVVRLAASLLLVEFVGGLFAHGDVVLEDMAGWNVAQRLSIGRASEKRTPPQEAGGCVRQGPSPPQRLGLPTLWLSLQLFNSWVTYMYAIRRFLP